MDLGSFQSSPYRRIRVLVDWVRPSIPGSGDTAILRSDDCLCWWPQAKATVRNTSTTTPEALVRLYRVLGDLRHAHPVLGSRGFYLEPSAAHRRDGIIVFGPVRAASRTGFPSRAA